MQNKTISDHPLVIGKMIERNRIRNAKWILRMHRREKWKATWMSLGILAGAALIYWLWQPLHPSHQIESIRKPGILVEKPSIEING